MGRAEYPEHRIVEHYLALLKPGQLNVLTVHAEIEGMQKRALFREFLLRSRAAGVGFVVLRDVAQSLLQQRDTIPVCDLRAGEVDGRSGTLALQHCPEDKR